MDYEKEIIGIIKSIKDNRVLAFIYGMLEYLSEYLEGRAIKLP